MVSLTAVASLEHVGTEDEIVAASCARGKPAPEAAMTVPQRRRCVPGAKAQDNTINTI